MHGDAADTAESVVSTKHKRLFGLWLVCVVFAVCALFNFLGLLGGTALGKTVFGGFTAAFLVAAVLLWSRAKRSWLLAIAVWLVWLAWLGLLSWSLPSLTGVAVGGTATLALVVYLIWRRSYFGGKTRPSFRSFLFLVTFGFVGLMFLAVGLLSVDAAARQFPKLQFQEQTPPPERNGYTLFEEIQKQGLFQEPESADPYWGYVPETGSVEIEKWLPKARKILQDNAACLAAIDEMMSRPQFVSPSPKRPYHPSLGRGTLARNLARLLILRSAVTLAEGRNEKALGSAWKAAQFGLLWAGGRGGTIDYLTGVAIMQLGLHQMRTVAASPSAETPLVKRALGWLQIEEHLIEAFKDSLRAEFQQDRTMMKVLNDPAKLAEYTHAILSEEMPQKADVANGMRWQAHFMGNLCPFLKVNMSINRLGTHYSRLLHVAEKPMSSGGVPSRLPPEVTMLDWLRNPIGNILMNMQFPADDKLLELHWHTVASIRATTVALALRGYQLEHGGFPPVLERLTPHYLEKVPEAPFTGQMMGYAPSSKPSVVFSVGPNGRREKEVPEDKGDDIVVEMDFPALVH